MVVPIDRVGGNMLSPRWNTPEELELDEVHGEGTSTNDNPAQFGSSHLALSITLVDSLRSPTPIEITLWLLWLAACPLPRERGSKGSSLGVFGELLEV